MTVLQYHTTVQKRRLHPLPKTATADTVKGKAYEQNHKKQCYTYYSTKDRRKQDTHAKKPDNRIRFQAVYRQPGCKTGDILD